MILKFYTLFYVKTLIFINIFKIANDLKKLQELLNFQDFLKNQIISFVILDILKKTSNFR